MLTLYRRHMARCLEGLRKKGLSREAIAAHYKCGCPIWIRGSDSRGKPHRETLNTNDDFVANELKREIDAGIEKPKAISIADAAAKWIDAGRAAKRKEGTIQENERHMKNMQTWCEHKGLLRLSEITTDTLDGWIATWTCAASTHITRLRVLRAFFNFCLRRKWVTENPAKECIVPDNDAEGTMPYTDEEWKAIEGALDTWTEARIIKHSSLWSQHVDKAKALILVLRWTGLRMSDAFRFEPRHIRPMTIDGETVYTYQTHQRKTGEPVFCGIPPDVAKYLTNCARFSEQAGHAFQPTAETYNQHGIGTRVDTTQAQALFRRTCLDHIATASGVKGVAPHRFRDTFAVDLLNKDAPMGDVALLLGHTSIATTERHYAKFVRSRQEKLLRHQLRAWDTNSDPRNK